MTVMQVMRAFDTAAAEFRKLIPRFWGIARELFHEIVGFLFLAIALYFVLGREGLIRTLQTLDENPDNFPQLLLVLFFVLMFGAFGVSSFLRARRISRERQQAER